MFTVSHSSIPDSTQMTMLTRLSPVQNSTAIVDAHCGNSDCKCSDA